MDFNVLSDLFYNLFVQDVFGSKLAFGVGILVLIGYIAFKNNISFTAFGIILVFSLILLSGFELLPIWIGIIVSMVLMLIIGFGILRIGRR